MRYLTVAALLIASGSACGPRGEDELFLLPDAFTGPVVVVFGQPDGQPLEYRAKRRVFRIPRGGVLKTQFVEQYGMNFSSAYHYTRGDTLIQQIPAITDLEATTADTALYIFRVVAGAVNNIETIGSASRTTGVRFYYRGFVVGHVAAGETLARQAEQLLDRVIQEHR
jgi:hypothetical protein